LYGFLGALIAPFAVSVSFGSDPVQPAAERSEPEELDDVDMLFLEPGGFELPYRSEPGFKHPAENRAPAGAVDLIPLEKRTRPGRENLPGTSSQDEFEPPHFGGRVDLGLVEHDDIDEASGIAASRKNPAVLWVHNDSGDSNRLFALNARGEHLGFYHLAGCDARDWEDMAVGPGPEADQQYLYVGDIGDNGAQYEYKYIYRVLEPHVDPLQEPVEETLEGADTITFSYPDNRQDAEALMVDPLTADIYIVTKILGFVYRLPYPQSTTEPMIADHVGSLHLGLQLVTGGDIASNGCEVLTKTYAFIYYWHCEPGESLWTAFEGDPILAPYIPEVQGEAVAWRARDMGYFTVSEESLLFPAHLYFYPRFNIARQPLPD